MGTGALGTEFGSALQDVERALSPPHGCGLINDVISIEQIARLPSRDQHNLLFGDSSADHVSSGSPPKIMHQ